MQEPKARGSEAWGMHLVFYSSSHGFGHASRDAQILAALARTVPQVKLHWRTAVAPWFLDDALQGVPHERSEAVLDVGIRQPHGTEQDLDATLEACQGLLAQHADLLTQEIAFLQTLKPQCVVSDVASIPLVAAARCSIPGFALSNFSWDWIYQELGLWGFAPVVDRFRQDYAQAESLLRLPFHGGDAACTAFARVEDLGLVARVSQLGHDEARRALGFEQSRHYVLVSFGGLGAGRMDLEALEAPAYRDFCFLLTPPLSKLLPSGGLGHLEFVDTERLRSQGLLYQDLVRACDAVITKPGYGIVSECLANETRVLYTSRGAFAEYPYLVEALERDGCAAFIEPQDLYAGRWLEPLQPLMARPRRAYLGVADGAGEVARRLCALAALG